MDDLKQRKKLGIACTQLNSQHHSHPSTTLVQHLPCSGDSEKRLRALNKKLRCIEELQDRASRGEELDEQQQSKLATLDAVLSGIEEVMGGGR